MRNHAGRTTKRIAVFVATGAAAVLMVASLAWACTQPQGATFFSDGKLSKDVAKGTRITAFATGAVRGVQYQLVIGSNGPHPAHACHVKDFTVNPNVRMAAPDGFIGNTSGPAGDANLPSGTYQVCFRDVAANSATAAVTLTVF